MKLSDETRHEVDGANVTLTCKYTPLAPATWAINGHAIDLAARPGKYAVKSFREDGGFGGETQVSEINIWNFEYADIAK